MPRSVASVRVITLNVPEYTARSLPRCAAARGRLSFFVVCVAGLVLASVFPGRALAADVTGDWQGTWTSGAPGNSGSLFSSIVQSGTSLSGTMTVTNTGCGDLTFDSVTGHVSDTSEFGPNSVSLQGDTICPLNGSSIKITILGGLSGNTVSGNYEIEVIATGALLEAGQFDLSRPDRIITASAGLGGIISPSGSISVTAGTSQTFAITPNPGFSVLDVVVDGESVGAETTFTFTDVTSNHTIDASFVANPVVTATAGPGGTILPTGSVSVSPGGNQTFNISPNSGFAVLSVIVDGDSIAPVTAFTFTNVTSDHTIEASFFEVYPAIAPALQLLTDEEGAQ